jgi:hypothetical protein
MKPAFVSLLATFFLAGTSWAQAAPEPGTAQAPNQGASTAQNSSASNSATPTPAANQLTAGTIISLELSKSLDARKNKTNDKIEAKTSMDLLLHGQIVIPRNTKIIGHVTEAKAHSKESPNSQVGLTFDRVLMKDGRELPLQAAVQAIARPLQPVFAVPVDDPMATNPTGIPSSSAAQRGAMAGAAAQPSSYGSSYPAAAASGPHSESMPPMGSTVSPLGPTSKGVVGMKGLSLNTSGEAAIVSSSTENVHLDSGTQLILRVQ